MKIFETPSTFLLGFVAAPKTNPGTGGKAGLIEYRAMLKLDSFALAGRSCHLRSDDSPKNSGFQLPYNFRLFRLSL